VKGDCGILIAAIGAVTISAITIVTLMAGCRAWLAAALGVEAIFEDLLVNSGLLVDNTRAGRRLL
jgi:hypothetical protein